MCENLEIPDRAGPPATGRGPGVAPQSAETSFGCSRAGGSLPPALDRNEAAPTDARSARGATCLSPPATERVGRNDTWTLRVHAQGAKTFHHIPAACARVRQIGEKCLVLKSYL